MRLLALPLLLASGVALAQTPAIIRPLVSSRGLTLPPESTALVDEATALSINPAGLRFVDAPQLFYVHERHQVLDQVGNGLFTGTSLFGVAGVGFGVEWLRHASAPDYRRTSFGFSLGTDTLALGATHHAFSSADSEGVDRLSSWDIGLSGRPCRGFSYGLVAKDLNEPEEGAFRVQRTFELGVGLRPFGERYTLGVDYLLRRGGLDEGRLSYTLKTEVVPGLRLSAGASHGLQRGEALAVQVAATLDTAFLGLTYAGGGTEDGLDHSLALRMSLAPYRSLRRPSGVVALVDLNDRLAGGVSPSLALLGISGPDPYLRLMRFLELATQDERLRGVVLKVEGLGGVDWGRAEELRQAVLRLRAAGKKVLALVLSCDDKGYFVASAADRLYALPASSFLINGLSAGVTSVGGTMEKLGVSWDVARVGEYKTAPEQLTRRDMSEAERETLNAWLDTQVDWYEQAVVSERKLPVERLREAWKVGLIPPPVAQSLGLIDGILQGQKELEQRLEQLIPGASYAENYSPRDEQETRWGRRRRIAIVPVLGTIAGGKSREDPLGATRIAGAETVALALYRAQMDPAVVAIVLRVDSGGGDVLASDLMYRAVLEAKKVKPVIASMGDVAASGGYYAAMAADEIFANPTTLTGSIGVFYLKPALKGLLEDKLGITQQTLPRAPLADLLGLWRPWTPEEQRAVQAWVDATYDTFITYAAEARKLEKAQVDTLARGRVWSGKDAHARGLVDRLGGLAEAVAAARSRGGASASEDVEVVVYGEARGFLSSLGGEPGVLARLLPEPSSPLPPGLQGLLRDTGLTGSLLEPGLKAALPFAVSVE
ncbi:signal peptide peptidase SppA [Stigmatella aurantiaca]|uniref:Signal peptide peptidase SppA, 36K type n=1 Tax=Stigmatella aurantiaca (strain DW4/3-1) TaxID=378806 RepID=Q08NW4_STIAD|nr:signal peptide peptidase SppA [Stigmatella aurantiaca]ADO70939.1 Signal peptide peptidase SppA, 36K type [Stigmatella aurantiaca DW4/3-1]EAU62169.1 signal peptide peptidase SppA, 67K type [Stigmatella aurantiaca DW4/3-1]